ncbi:MAG: hypothetical protein V3U09_00475 [Thermoplasmata archaeon]
MTIERNAATMFLKEEKLRYSGPLTNPGIHSNYNYLEIFSDELPIYSEKEFDVAKSVGGKHSLVLKFHDFSPGEGLGKGVGPNYEPVFIYKCKSNDQLEEAPKRIAEAIHELKQRLKGLL